MVQRKQDGKLITRWYQKPTASQRILNFNSQHSINHKINIVKNLMHRSTQLSHPQYHQEDQQIIRKILKNNGYPTKFIKTHMYNSTKKKSVYSQTADKDNDITTITDNTKVLYYKIPYIPGLNKQITRCLKPLKGKLINYNLKKVNCIYTKLKDKTPYELTTEIVYKVPCNHCPQNYIGQTKQHIKKKNHTT